MLTTDIIVWVLAFVPTVTAEVESPIHTLMALFSALTATVRDVADIAMAQANVNTVAALVTDKNM